MWVTLRTFEKESLSYYYPHVSGASVCPLNKDGRRGVAFIREYTVSNK